MKASCLQKDLHFALEVSSKAISPNTTLPVLNNILVKAANKRLFFSATNLEIAINVSIPAEVKNEGSLTIPAKLITSYTNLLEDESVDIKAEAGMTLCIESKSSQTKIKGISPDEFPLIPKVERENSFSIPAHIFLEAIESTVFSAAPTPTRPVLSGVYFRGEKDELKLAATDSYRLAEKTIRLEKKLGAPIECIVPIRTLLELGKILSLKYEKEPVEITISKTQALFSIDGVELISRLIEGKFPDYQKIIPRTTKTKIEADASRLALTTKRVSLFAKENNNSIKLAATHDGKLQITTDETRVGEERAELEIKITGENNKVALNAQYLLDVLSHLKDKVQIEMDEKLTPVLVKPLKKEDYIYIIMPLKI